MALGEQINEFEGVARRTFYKRRKPFFKKFGWTQQLRYFADDASDSYHSLQVVADKRFTRGYQVLAHYTWSKAMGYDPDYYAPDPKLNYGVANTDRKHYQRNGHTPHNKPSRLLSKRSGSILQVVEKWGQSVEGIGGRRKKVRPP